MSYLQAILLGVLQGLTEFLPVSSSGHLAFAEREFGWQEGSLAFSVVVHLGTLLAVVVAYRAPLLAMLRDRRRAIVPLALGTAPLFLVLPIKDAVESLHGNPYVIASGFCLTAVLLLLCDPPWGGREDEPEATQRLEELSVKQTLVVGCAQLCAILEGISRSGSTIAAGVLTGSTRPLAAEFGFLLAIPAILGAAVLEARHIQDLAQQSPGPLVAGFVAALITGLGAIYLLQWLLRLRRFWVFAPYLLVAAAVTVWRGQHWAPL